MQMAILSNERFRRKFLYVELNVMRLGYISLKIYTSVWQNRRERNGKTVEAEFRIVPAECRSRSPLFVAFGARRKNYVD